jgi:hypothetical protein
MGIRRRSAAVWLCSVPLMVVGSQLGHAVAYRVVYPQAHLRLRALLSSGHGYMAGHPYVAMLAAAAAAVELLALLWAIADTGRRRPHRPPPAWTFAVLPLVGFAVQEFLERWLAGATFPWQVVLEPTFRIGLVVQLPFALAAFLVARLLLGAAELAAAAIAPRVRRLTFPEAPLPSPRQTVRPLRLLVEGHAGRGPPDLTALLIS